ncbi:MAG: hypothetical protein QOI48_54 [Solirubrobacteraceae bacterium]|jgi:hypothetical protein|nr:hypothetical protein [Solirubrobacteraceae bacterium]
MTEPQLDPSLPPFLRAETFLRGRAEIDLPELSLADVTADVLGKVLERLDLPEPDGEPSDEWIQTKALMYLGVLAGRSLRSVVVLLRSGYDSEALVFKRRLDEIAARVQRVADVEHGAQRARDWLAGKDRKPSSVVELPEGSWARHSHVAHADYRAVEQHLVERRDGRTDFTLIPHRTIDKATRIGLISAVLTRDIAYGIAAFKELTIDGDEDYEAALLASVDRWLRPPDDESS